jgi:transposase InsO family protein
MPWKEVSVMSQRLEFVQMASSEQANIRHLCRHFNISAPTAYKWLYRFQSGQPPGLLDRSRRPHHSPRRTAAEIERLVVELRTAHPAWGGRKIHARLIALGHPEVPQPSTISAILNRHYLIESSESAKRHSFCRFEHPRPNDLWQMDFKGDFAVDDGRCFPLTVLDDHSRFALGLRACPGQSTIPTQTALREVFRSYGLPSRMTMDNGSPWGSSNKPGAHTRFTIWLLRLGVAVSHSRPYHPQTQGKDERFHRTLQAEVLRHGPPSTLAQCQREFDRWRDLYNCQRPHEALGMQVPASRYQPSRRPFPEVLPPVDYDTSDIVRKVRGWGHIRYHSRDYYIGQAFKGLHVALRQTATDGLLDVYFCQHRLTQIQIVTSTKQV